MDGYCENADCRVIMFVTATDAEHPEDGVTPPPVNRNCPSCGRLGRLKDEPPKKGDEG